jgi:hypothetical protein
MTRALELVVPWSKAKRYFGIERPFQGFTRFGSFLMGRISAGRSLSLTACAWIKA